jgi:hypothetical protein
MWALLIAAMALAQTDQSAWRAGWERAKARADLEDRLRTRRITHDEFLKAHLRLLTPQEEAEMRAFFEQEAINIDARMKERKKNAEKALEALRRIRETPDKRKPPPDVK